MPTKRPRAPIRLPAHERVSRWLAGPLIGAVLFLLAAQVMLSIHFNTAQVQRRLQKIISSGTDSLYLVRVGSSKFSMLAGSFVIDQLEIYPDTAAFARRMPSGMVSQTRYHAKAATVRASGIGLLALLVQQRVQVTSATIDSFAIDVSMDRTHPDRRPPSPGKLPHQHFQHIPRPVRIDLIRFEHSEVSYSERALDGARYGKVHFDSVEATIKNLTNEPGRMSDASRCDIDIHALLMGAGETAVRFEYDLSAPDLSLAYRGSVGRMDATAMNAMAVNLEGVRLRSGMLDSVWFKVDVSHDLAKGQIQVRYHDLEVETLDKVTRDRSLGDKIGTFFANHFKLKSENPPKDDPPTVAYLWLQRAPESSFFKFVWETLRQGVFKTLGF